MIVYRLESNSKMHDDNIGKGVYRGNLAHLATDSGEDIHHPTPQQDVGLNMFNHTFVCCFSSLEGLNKWFENLKNGSQEAFEELQISTYKVSNKNYHQGRFQSIALSSDMVCIERHDIEYKESLL